MLVRNLADFRMNVYSQNGEDGVLREIFNRLGGGREPRWCVEFGAWDGKHLSNTFLLVESNDWNAIYIESDSSRFLDLETTARLHEKIMPIHATVGFGGEGGLDEILSGTNLPKSYDLLSIDIDSYDLEVWYHHVAYSPSVVVIEINSSIPPGVLQWHVDGSFQGNSFASTLAVGRSKGYSLVCHTGNLIFVRDDLVPRLKVPEVDLRFPERLFHKFVSKESKEVPVRSRFIQFVTDSIYRLARLVLGETTLKRISNNSKFGKRGGSFNTPKPQDIG